MSLTHTYKYKYKPKHGIIVNCSKIFNYKFRWKVYYRTPNISIFFLNSLQRTLSTCPTHPDRLFDGGQVEISDTCYTCCLIFYLTPQWDGLVKILRMFLPAVHVIFEIVLGYSGSSPCDVVPYHWYSTTSF